MTVHQKPIDPDAENAKAVAGCLLFAIVIVIVGLLLGASVLGGMWRAFRWAAGF